MPAAKFKLHIEQGATYDRFIRWRAGGVLVDLTGCTARMDIRPKAGSTELLLRLTTENGMLVLGGVDGTINFNIDSETTAGLTWHSGVHDLLIYFPNGSVRRLVKGPATVEQGVTLNA